MPIDPSIPLQALQGMYDPSQTVGNVVRLRDLMQQQQMRQMEMQDATDERQRRTTMREALAGAYDPASGSVDYGKVKGAYAQAGDIEGVMNIEESIQKMSAEQRKAARERAQGLASTAYSLLQVPYEQRRQALMAAAPRLQETYGLAPEQIASFDPTDQAINSLVAEALGLEKQIDKADKDRTHALNVDKFGEQQRHNRTTEGISAGNLSVSQTRLGIERERFNHERATGGASGKQARRDEIALRKEFNGLPDVKAFNDVRQSYRTIQQIAQNPSAANDLALIFSYMKMLDPGSVVREGEFANAQNAAGVPDRIRNLYNKSISGERMNPEQRQKFVSSAGDVYQSRIGRYNELANQYRSYAADYGGEPDRVARPERVRPKPQAGGTGKASGGGWGKAKVVD